MTYLAIANKAGYGPGIWVVKDDAVNYLTTPYTSFGSFLFNSENQNISYVKEPWKRTLNAASVTADGYNDYIGNNMGGTATTCTRSIFRTTTSGTLRQYTPYAFPQTLFAGDAFIPMAEARLRDTVTGRISAANRVRNWVVNEQTNQHGVMTAYQFPNVLMQMTNFSGSGLWRGRMDPRFSGRPNAWVVKYGNGLNGSDAGNPSVVSEGTFSGNTFNAKEMVTVWWDLPANNAAIPKPSQPVVSGQEVLRLNSSGLVLARPGYTVDESYGRQRIIDSTRNPPLCIMAGETASIAVGGNAFVAAPPGISLSNDCVVEIMARVTGATQYVPALIISGYTPDFDVALTYSVASNGVTFYNDGQSALTVRYIVFGVDFRSPSTGGNQVMRRANDGVQDYIQIKNPGTSDTAPLPNDILIDTRFPMLQIAQEGFIQMAEFTEASDNAELGSACKTISFANAGFRPFLKYAVNFTGCILPPMFAQIYHYPEGSGAFNHRPTNQSAIAQVTDTSVKFYLAPGNPSDMTSSGGGAWSLNDTYPDPIGIRYYVFAIPL
ncbi:hypothetical protein C5748_18505 [Phyllobacterium phragmitis]|uniref:Uncharacterized protein n=1 Tax=Phyllobacterium phragmitis TaxID=2670329 RepID=A0A2S9INN4_9HYPH|nr:hypothetical protein [Phyllobacterium phragmitis]PRD42140.1 hypothetical protein C5748_18505 [Phyllobacterium phragmitis]